MGRRHHRSSREIIEDESEKQNKAVPGFLKRKFNEFKNRNSDENRAKRIKTKRLQRQELEAEAGIEAAKTKKESSKRKRMAAAMSMTGPKQNARGTNRSRGSRKTSLSEPGDSLLSLGGNESSIWETGSDSGTGLNDLFGTGSAKPSGPKKSGKSNFEKMFS